MTPLIIINLLIWLLLLVLMGTNKFPLGAVSLSIMLLLVLTGCITSPEALAKFSDNNVIIIGTMMITANAFGKTRAVKSIAKLLTKAGKGRWENAIRMFMVINFVLGFSFQEPLDVLPLFTRWQLQSVRKMISVLQRSCSRLYAVCWQIRRESRWDLEP